MQVTGVIQDVRTTESTKFPNTFSQWVTINNEQYNFLTKYPNNLNSGDEVTFDFKENGKYKNIDYKTIKVLKKHSNDTSGNPMGTLVQLIEAGFREVNASLSHIKTLIDIKAKNDSKPEQKPEFDDEIDF